MFNSAREFVVNGGTFINNYSPESGIGQLLQASTPEAALDSSAREYAAKCYPGTREQRIQEFVSWVSAFIAHQDRRFRMTWMSGPAGVGKSALAQTCAKTLGEDKMGAAFFFSRYNRRDNPTRLIPTLAYQIAVKIEPVAAILNAKIHGDPSLLSKTIEVQFRELIAAPLLELKRRDPGVQDRLVIIDGLDECEGDAVQCLIVETIATAIRRYGDDLPLLWAFFSRPEPHIVRTFNSAHVSPLCLPTTLPISDTTSEEMELYLRGKFDEIKGRSPHLPSSWPSGDDIRALMQRSNGFFAYASTATKFIGDPEALDPEERLKIVLALRSKARLLTNDYSSPMAELDMLYDLLMRQIPKRIAPVTLAIFLLLRQVAEPYLSDLDGTIPVLANFLGLSFQSFDTALSKLHSVLHVELRDEMPWQIRFEHASFMEFLGNSDRSGPDFWIKHPQQYNLLTQTSMQRLMELFETHKSSPGNWLYESMTLSAFTPKMEAFERTVIRSGAFHYCKSGFPEWLMLASMDDSLADALVQFDFKAWWDYSIGEFEKMSQLEGLKAKIPEGYREQIIRPQERTEPRTFINYMPWHRRRREPIYVLGQGEKSVLLMVVKDEKLVRVKVEEDGRITRVDELL